MDWYLKVIRQYADFSGRARRKEFWLFTLVNILILIALSFLDQMLGFMLFPQSESPGFLALIYSIFVFIPYFAVTVRRLHDTGRSGWWLLIMLIPLIGPIVILVFEIFESEPGTNQYGPNPIVD